MRGRRAAPLLLAAAVALAGALPARGGELRGHVRLELPGVALDAVRPLVVYLEPLEGAPPAAPAVEAPPVLLRQHHARFDPPFLLVIAGQRVEMPNDDDIYHNVFSFSVPNDFDLGLYPAGQSRGVRFLHPGVVRLYCSIHESMNGTVFVAPTPHAAAVDAEGGFVLPAVPRGRWRLRTWSERLPPVERELQVGAAPQEVEIRVRLGP